jgi:hypothetical protein
MVVKKRVPIREKRIEGIGRRPALSAVEVPRAVERSGDGAEIDRPGGRGGDPLYY